MSAQPVLDTDDIDEQHQGRVVELPVGDIVPSPDNHRRTWGDLDGLAASIGDIGVVQPLIVAPHPDRAGRWDLIAGERRLRASVMAGLATVPCIVRRLVPKERDEQRLLENSHRLDLDPVDQAAHFRLLIDRHGYTQTRLAERTGFSQPVISKRLKLLELPDAVLDELRPHDGSSTEGLTLEEAYELGKLTDHPDRLVEAMTGRNPDGYQASSVTSAVAQHLRDLEWAAKRADALEQLRRRGDRIVEPHTPPRGRFQLRDTTGVAPLGKGPRALDQTVADHRRHHADHHVVVVLADGEIVHGCDAPHVHDKAAKAKANGKLTGDQLHLVPEAAEAAARKAADEAAWRTATQDRRVHAGARLRTVRPTLGDTILSTLPALLHQLQKAPLKTACRLLDLEPKGTAYREALQAAVPPGDATEAARVLLALSIAIAEGSATQTRPSRWTQHDHVSRYLDWLRANGYELTDVEQRAIAGELDL